MKNKKGFTLIELMTVIVVLSIVLIIAYAVIRNNIEISKKETFKTSVKNVLESAKEYVIANFEENDFPAGGISVTDLNLEKTSIKSGIIMKNDEGIIEVVNLSSDDFCANGPKNDLEIKAGSCDKFDESEPEIDASVKNIGMDTMVVLVKMQDPQSGLKELEYCNGNECGKIELDNEKTEVKEFVKFRNLKPNTDYNLKFKVISNNENEKFNSKEISINETTLEIDKPTFTVSSSVYALSKIVEIKYPDVNGYTFKYKLNEEEEKDVTDKTVKLELDGESVVYAYVYKNEEIVAEDFIHISGIDANAPTLGIKLLTTFPTDPENYNGYVTNITLEFDSADAESGLAMRPFSYDGGKTWERTNKHTYITDGEYEVYVRDRLGNINKKFCDPTKTYKNASCECDEEKCKFIIETIDDIPPVCGEWKGESTSWIKGSRTITVDCSDTRSGCVQNPYATTYSNSIKTTNTSMIISDKLGNKTTCAKSTNVYVDNTKPKCGSFTGQSTSWTYGNRTIKLTCSDGHSGCKQSSFSKTYDYSVKTENWTQKIYDNVGNEETCSSNLNIYVDKQRPSIWANSTTFSGGSVSASSMFSYSCGISGCSTSYSPGTLQTYSRTTVYATIRSNAGLSSSTSASIGYTYGATGHQSCTTEHKCEDRTISVKQTQCCDIYNGCYGCPESEIQTVCWDETRCWISSWTCDHGGTRSGTTCTI